MEILREVVISDTSNLYPASILKRSSWVPGTIEIFESFSAKLFFVNFFDRFGKIQLLSLKGLVSI